eukprot:scaffold90043_cov75-Phaeocystis_antarctica.AAC.4
MRPCRSVLLCAFNTQESRSRHLHDRRRRTGGRARGAAVGAGHRRGLDSALWRGRALSVLGGCAPLCATFRLSIRGQPLNFQCTASCEVGETGGGLLGPAPLAPPLKKRMSDDWMELKVCPDAPFAFSRWSHRHHARSADPTMEFFSASAALVQ